MGEKRFSMNAVLRKHLVALSVASTLVAWFGDVAVAAPGDLDLSFGGDGRVITNLTSGFDIANDVAVQANGKIVAVGRAGGSDITGGRFALVRYNDDGTLDSSFGGDGKVTTDFAGADEAANSVAIQADGKIVVAGRAGGDQPKFALARYNADGILDSTFGGADGKVRTDLTPGDDIALAVLLQGTKIVAVGTANGDRFALARYNANGTLDPSFSGNGKVRTNFTPGFDVALGAVLQPDQKIVAVGTGDFRRFALARYNPNGTLDPTFSGDGKVLTNFTPGDDFALAVTLQGDGAIVAAGRAAERGGRFALARYATSGTLDTTFSSDGKVVTNFTVGDDQASGVAIQGDGKIVAAGSARAAMFALARYNTNGTRDASFSGNGKVRTNFTPGFDFANAVTLQADGKIVAAGRCDGKGGRFALARYLDQ
jgi:uncharacterized delta-60 repeat protein